jgi:hypothetical protein
MYKIYTQNSSEGFGVLLNRLTNSVIQGLRKYRHKSVELEIIKKPIFMHKHSGNQGNILIFCFSKP